MHVTLKKFVFCNFAAVSSIFIKFMYQKSSPRGADFVFKKFCRKSFALFAALGKEVKIGVLTVATLATAAPCLASGTATALSVCHGNAKDDGNDEDLPLGEAVATASRAPLAADVAARMVTSFSREDLAAAGITSINDLLKLCAGVDVRQRGSFGVQTDISIDGGTFDQITLLINGVAINNPQTGHNAAEFPLNLTDITRVEVLRGAASRVLGTQAFSGAINIVTRRDKKRMDADLSAGSYGTLRGEVRRQGQWDFGSGSLGYASISGSFTRSDGAVHNSDFSSKKFFAQSGYNHSLFRLDLQAGATLSDFGANTFYSTKSSNQWEATRRYLVSLRGESKGALHIVPLISWLRNVDHFQFIRNTPTYENFNLGDVFTLGLNAWKAWKAGRTAFGAEMREEGLYSGNLGRDMDPADYISIPGKHAIQRDKDGIWRDAGGSIAYYTKQISRTNVSYFIEHDILLPKWTFSLGIMAQRNTSIDEKFRFCPGMDLSYRPSTSWKLFASWNRSMRLPTFTDLYYKNPSQEGNTGLRPESNNAFRMGGEWQIRRGINFSATAFYHRMANVLDWVMYTPKDKFHATNFRLDNFGASATMTIHGDILWGTKQPLRRLCVDYTLMNQDRKDHIAFFKSNYALEYLRHKLVATLDHRIVSHLGASWVLRVQERNGQYIVMDRTNPGHLIETGKTAPYGTHARLDLKLRWDMQHYSLYFDLQNLTNHRFFDLANVEQPGFFLMAGATVSF